MSEASETFPTLKDVEILRYLAEKKWRTCEPWSLFPPEIVEPLVRKGLVDHARGTSKSSRRRITRQGLDLLALIDAGKSTTALARAQSADLLPIYQQPPERVAKAGELKGRMGFEFKKTVKVAYGHAGAGPNALRMVHAAMLGAPFCDFTDEPIEKWAAVGHNWIKVDVSSIEEAAAVQVAGGLRKDVTCSGCLQVLSSTKKTLDRMIEIARDHA